MLHIVNIFYSTFVALWSKYIAVCHCEAGKVWNSSALISNNIIQSISIEHTAGGSVAIVLSEDNGPGGDAEKSEEREGGVDDLSSAAC